VLAHGRRTRSSRIRSWSSWRRAARTTVKRAPASSRWPSPRELEAQLG